MDKTTFDAQFRLLLTQACDLIPVHLLPDLPAMPQSPEILSWHPHELALWDIGEQLRQLLAASGRHLNDDQTDAILQICLNPNAGRGRQSFVLLLGRVRYACCADAIAPLLLDMDVCGQAVNTLYKMKVSGYGDAIRPLLTHKQAWVRQEAKRYFQKYDI